MNQILGTGTPNPGVLSPYNTSTAPTTSISPMNVDINSAMKSGGITPVTPTVKPVTPPAAPVKPVISTPAQKTTPAPVYSNPVVTTPSGMNVNASTGGIMPPTYTPPAAPAPTTPYQDAISNYQKMLAPTAEEEQLAKDQANLDSSLRTAYTNTEGQSIPIEFITGQKRRLQESAADLAAPLTAKATLLNARRVAGLEASKFAIEQNKPVNVSPGSELINPLTGERVASVAAKTAATDDPNKILSPSEAQALGVPYGTTASQAYGKNPQKPLTESQGKDLAYASRGGEAMPIIEQFSTLVSGYNPAQWLAATTAENTTLGNAFVSPEIQQVRQAERNFGTAILRRESGATIQPSEFAVMEKQYFPRPGDSAEVLAQKAQNRATAVNSIRQSAGASAFGGNNNSGNTTGSTIQTSVGVINTNW